LHLRLFRPPCFDLPHFPPQEVPKIGIRLSKGSFPGIAIAGAWSCYGGIEIGGCDRCGEG
ncbi:hypothetical protein A2U01_0097679, partial [Trifolium medium]|nr:hypothetical protein [Trifolium medium]